MALHVEGRPAQTVPEQITADLLGVIRGQFCGGMDAKQWCQNRRFFLRVVTYPAAWLTKRGVTLPPARYKALLLDIFSEVKTHGQTDRVSFWPGYLLHVVQEHFKHHGDALYEEAKSARAVAHLALSKVTSGRQAPDAVESLAQAASLLRIRRAPKAPVPKGSQLSLL